MMRTLPPLSALRVLEALWRTGSVSAAAETLHVSHSAISHHIKALEEHADVPLARRKGRRVVLTPAGQSLGKVLNESFIAIAHELDLLALREREPVTVAGTPAVMSGWLMPKIHAFQKRHPHMTLHLSEAVTDSALAGEPDIHIGFSRTGELPYGAHRLIGGRAVPVASPAFLERHRVKDDADILQMPCVHDEDSRMWKEWFRRAGLQPDSALPPRLYVGSANLSLDLVLQGQVVGLCREHLIKDLLQEGRLVALSEIGIDDHSCYFLKTAERHLPRQAEAFAEYLLAEAG